MNRIFLCFNLFSQKYEKWLTVQQVFTLCKRAMQAVAKLLAVSSSVLVLELLESSNGLSGNVASAIASPLSSKGGHGRVELRVQLAVVIGAEDLNVISIIDYLAASSAVLVPGFVNESKPAFELIVEFFILLVIGKIECCVSKSLNKIRNNTFNK